MTFVIFALAVAQPHHNARHTVDDGAEHTGLTPEVVLPTEEVETTEEDLEASVRHHIYMPLPLTYRLINLREILFFNTFLKKLTGYSTPQYNCHGLLERVVSIFCPLYHFNLVFKGINP